MEGFQEYSTRRSTCAQVLAALAFNCLQVNVGMILGMPTIVIGALRLTDRSMTFTDEQASWFGGMIFVVQPIGSLMSGFLQDVFGRKACMQAVTLPQLFGWLLMYNATSVATLFVSMTLLGLSIGFMEAPVLSYIGEISEPRLRGVLSTLGGPFFNLGLMIESLMGAFMSWRSMVLYSALGPMIAFMALSMVPDSPAWLVSKGRVDDAQKAYQWLRGWVAPNVVQEEVRALVANFKNTSQRPVVSRAVGANHAQACSSKSKLKIFFHPSVQRPLRLILIYSAIACCASLTAMRPFFIELLDQMNLPVRPHLVVVFGCILTTLGSLTATLTMRRAGKRGLTFISLGLSSACCYALAVYLTVDHQLPWIPLAIFCVSYYAAPLGIILVPWILISELFPLRGRGLAGGVAAAAWYLLIFIVIKTYFNIIAVMEVSGACFLYGTVGTLGFVYLYFRLPETEGVPMDKLDRLFTAKRTENGNPTDRPEEGETLRDLTLRL